MMMMSMLTRAEKEGVREGEREREREAERREGRKKRGETERQNTDMDPKHLYSCANHFKITNGCLSRGPSRRFQGAPTTQNGLFWAGPVYFQRKNFSSENTTRVRSKGFKCRIFFATDREHAHALQHVTAKVQSCQATSHRRN